MNFELEQIVVEDDCRDTELAKRIVARLADKVLVTIVADTREIVRAHSVAGDGFSRAKRVMVIARKRSPFLMACPAGSAEFACCGYLVMSLASNCPMDCSYCFLQEYLANNPALQLFANYRDALDEISRLRAKAPQRHFRIGTGELADSLAFDSLTGVSIDLVEYFAASPGMLLELKTKTDEIDNLLRLDSKGGTLVSWTLSPDAVWRSSEHRTASPATRIAAAAKVLEHGYKVAFHLDPIIAYDQAETDYPRLLEMLFDSIRPETISFISMGGLRMTPGLRGAALRRFPADPMLQGEDVLSPDGRFRTFTPMRMRLYRLISEHIKRANPSLTQYLCMENPSVHEKIFGARPAAPAAMGEVLAAR